ncbi:P12 morphogenetic protein [Pseudomonas phage phi13]|uniref:p12 n=1 Tax=Pseudomonas phage phi13 TaxID=134554 RepID=Q9FZU1_9VIRU|nr:P12 morphogenetic protein [Pseudomonas phage phi13]AAG00435.1 P12 [Pseudomonas phage phi13]
MLARLFNASAAIPIAAKMLGVTPDALSQLAASATGALSPHAGPGFSVVPMVMALAKGDLTPLRALYENVLSVKAARPAIASAITEWLEQNDTDHIAMKAMGYVADLPLQHLGRDFSSVEEFLTDGLFPLMDTALAPPTVCHCGGHLSVLSPTLLVCDECETYKDI